MRKKFFERTYLLTLVLFLAFLNGSILSLVAYTHHNTLQSEEQVCISEEFAVREAFERDYKDGKFSSDRILQIAYCNFYGQKDIFLAFSAADGEGFSTIPEGLSMPAADRLAGEIVDGKRYILITDIICDGAFTMTFAKDVTYLDQEFKELTLYFVTASLLASVLLSFLLYFTLRRLYSPLDKLRKITQSISAGDLSARADASGDDEFSALAKDFNDMADRVADQMDRLKETAEQKQRMLDDLAHEMRTPLTGIYGYAEYICSAKITQEDQIEAAQYIMEESMRLKSISQVLLDSAFIRQGKIERKRLQAAALLEAARKHHGVYASEHGVEIVCLPGNSVIEGDPTLLEILLSNLMENAIKACREGGRVELSVYREEGPVICVADNGIGMKTEELSHITEPFYRVEKARSRQDGGTGLGLALCATIAQAHGAQMFFDSQLNKGTKVFVKFK